MRFKRFWQRDGEVPELVRPHITRAVRLESLKNITERYDSYGNSIRKVMDNKHREQGLLGLWQILLKWIKNMRLPWRLHLAAASEYCHRG